MSEKAPKITVEQVRRRLAARFAGSGDKITLDGEPIGALVRYGAGKVRGNVGSRTVYASRIYSHDAIEEEAGSPRVLIDKVARAIARSAREGRWPLPPAPPVNPVAS